METKLTEQQSLAVISEMIDLARNNIQRGAGTSMIFWGCFTASVALLNILLAYLLPVPTMSFWIWSVMILGGIVEYFIKQKKGKEVLIKTHIDRIIASTWAGFTISTALLILILFAIGIGTQMPHFYWLFTPIILLMAGLAEYITSVATKFKPFLIGSLSMWVGALLCIAILFFSSEAVMLQFVILAVCMIIGFVLPGIQLNRKAENHV